MILCLLLYFLCNLQISLCFQNPSDPESFTSAARYKTTNISQNLMSSHQSVYTQKCIMYNTYKCAAPRFLNVYLILPSGVSTYARDRISDLYT